MTLTLRRLEESELDRWDQLYNQAHRPALSQSRAYAEALASARGWLSDYYLIEENSGLIGGCIIQTQHAPIGKATRVERGPVWQTDVSEEQKIEALRQLAELTKPGLLERRRFYPDVSDGSGLAAKLPTIGFKTVDTGYRTIWLDLRMDLNERRKQLRQNWRYALNKAEQASVTIEIDRDGEHLNWLAAHQEQAMRRQRFTGPRTPFLQAIRQQTTASGHFLMLRALYLGKPIAAALIIRHGSAATYLVGWSGKLGRKYNAQHRLLWQALEQLSNEGVSDFDLGGLNPDHAAGVTYFKRGLLTDADSEVISAPIQR